MKQVDSVAIVQNQDKSDQFTIATNANEVTFYKVLPLTDTNFTNKATSHFWSLIGLYDLFSYNQINKPFTEGGLLNTALAGVVDAFYSNGAVAFNTSKTQYRVEIDGYNFGMKIPLDNTYTGATSGLSSTVLYSSFIYEPGCTDQDPGSICNGGKVDMLKSERLQSWTSNIGIGYPFIDGQNPDPTNTLYSNYDSGIVYLVTDPIYNTFTGATGSSLSWSVGFATQNKYTIGGARLISMYGGSNDPNIWNGPGYDNIVGIVNLKSGFGMIWNKDLVNAFDYTSFTGDFYTGATPTTSGTTVIQGTDIDYETVAQISIIADRNTYRTSSNPSYIGLNQSCDVVIPTICLYDKDGNTIAIGKSNEAIPHGDDYFITTLNVAISGNIDESNSIVNRGIITPLV